MNPVAERVLGGALAQDAVERLDKDPDRPRSARQRHGRAEDESAVLVAARGVLMHERHEVGGVLGDERAPLSDAEREQFLVGQAAELPLRLDRDHVVATFAQQRGDPGCVVLVEAEPQPRRAC